MRLALVAVPQRQPGVTLPTRDEVLMQVKDLLSGCPTVGLHDAQAVCPEPSHDPSAGLVNRTGQISECLIRTRRHQPHGAVE